MGKSTAEIRERHKQDTPGSDFDFSDMDIVGLIVRMDLVHKDRGILLDMLEAAEATIKALGKFAHHKNSCNGYPANSEEYVEKHCDCGLQALIKKHNASADSERVGK